MVSSEKKLRLVVEGFAETNIRRVLQNLHRQFPLDHLCFIYSTAYLPADAGEFSPIPPKIASIDAVECSFGEYATDAGDLPPLEERVIEQMAPFAETILKMIGRMDPNYVSGYEQRQRIYFKHLRFWANYLETNGINLYLASDVPHEPLSYVLYSLCKVRGIPVILFSHIPITDRIITFADWKKPDADWVSALKKPVSTDEIELDSAFEAYFARMRAPEQPAPFYMEINAKNRAEDLKRNSPTRKILSLAGRLIYKPWKIIKVFSPTWWFKRFSPLLSNAEIDLFNFYAASCQTPDLETAFIYVPLHFQPESTTCPQGGLFVFQELMIAILAAAAPKNWKLYIKEHPDQRLHGRDIRFYEDLLKIPRVQFIEKSYSSQKLSAHARAVATVTGTAGWEALFKGKPVLLFGNCFYQNAPGVFQIKTLDQAKAALDSILAGSAPNPQELRLFLRVLQDNCITAWLERVHGSITKLSPEQNVSNLTKVVTKKIGIIFQEK